MRAPLLMRFATWTVAIGLLSSGGTSALAQDTAFSALEATSESALADLVNSAEQGNVLSQLALGQRYVLGGDWTDSDQDFVQAAKWWRLAADQGNADAQFLIGDLYDRGLGVAEDDAQAMDWWRLSGQQGHVKAQSNLCSAYIDGSIVEQDYFRGRRWCENAASQGDGWSQARLGELYEEVFRQPVEAVRWYQLAAEQGHSEAQLGLCFLYHDGGPDLDKDYSLAARWCRAAAAPRSISDDDPLTRGLWHNYEGEPGAQFALGVMYSQGQGVPQDYAESLKWYHLAAEQGDFISQFNLGAIYESGRGTPQDFAEALKWYLYAAERGYAPAQYNLGAMYTVGKGVPQDFVKAHMWRNLAASRAAQEEVEEFAETRDALARDMPPDQIAEAQRLAREWKPKTWEELKPKD